MARIRVFLIYATIADLLRQEREPAIRGHHPLCRSLHASLLTHAALVYQLDHYWDLELMLEVHQAGSEFRVSGFAFNQTYRKSGGSAI